VVEAVHAKMEEKNLNAKEATIESLKEISGAIIAITLVMSTVFIPVSFLSGPVGIFYRQFSLTLAIAILISGLNALTLTPALCALMLKPVHKESKGLLKGFFKGFDRLYNKTENLFHKHLNELVPRKLFIVGLLLIFVAGLWIVSVFLPPGFIPTADQGVVYITVTTPAGSTVERTGKVLDEISAICKKMDAVENISTLGGYSLITESAGASFG